MPYRPFTDQNCSIAAALAIVGERWTLLVMREVLLGRRRFAEIREHTGAAPNILSDRLQTLVEHGVLERRRYSEKPESYEYLPTRKGRDVAPVLNTLMAWGDKHATPPGGPPRVTVHDACGHDAHPRLHCSHCGEPLRGDTHARPGPGATTEQIAAGVLPAA
jgi:DNA-binding HxlR family transcriptional regulator